MPISAARLYLAANPEADMNTVVTATGCNRASARQAFIDLGLNDPGPRDTARDRVFATWNRAEGITLSDRAVADLAGCTAQYVGQLRRRHSSWYRRQRRSWERVQVTRNAPHNTGITRREVASCTCGECLSRLCPPTAYWSNLRSEYMLFDRGTIVALTDGTFEVTVIGETTDYEHPVFSRADPVTGCENCREANSHTIFDWVDCRTAHQHATRLDCSVAVGDVPRGGEEEIQYEPMDWTRNWDSARPTTLFTMTGRLGERGYTAQEEVTDHLLRSGGITAMRSMIAENLRRTIRHNLQPGPDDVRMGGDFVPPSFYA